MAAQKTFIVHTKSENKNDFNLVFVVYSDEKQQETAEIFSVNTKDKKFFDSFSIGENYHFVKQK